MTLSAKATLQETRGSLRIVHCQVYERVIEDGETVREHRPHLDFDVVLSVGEPESEIQLAIAQRLKEIAPPAEPVPERALPAEMTADDARALVAAKEASAQVQTAAK